MRKFSRPQRGIKPRTAEQWAAEIRRRLPDHYVSVMESTWQSTFKPKGLRYITRRGPRRRGYLLQVHAPGGRRVFDETTADPAVRLGESVTHWLETYKPEKAK